MQTENQQTEDPKTAPLSESARPDAPAVADVLPEEVGYFVLDEQATDTEFLPDGGAS